jgi:hypothetical protein
VSIIGRTLRRAVLRSWRRARRSRLSSGIENVGIQDSHRRSGPCVLLRDLKAGNASEGQ